jgi:hypothetical protein
VVHVGNTSADLLSIGNGVTGPIGLPQLVVAGDLNFGGPGILPQGRFDTS